MRHIVRLTKVAPQFRWHTEDGKKIVSHARQAHTLRLDIAGGAGQIRIVPTKQREISETALAGAPIKVIRQANRTGIEKIGALAKEHGVDNAENCSFGADAER